MINFSEVSSGFGGLEPLAHKTPTFIVIFETPIDTYNIHFILRLALDFSSKQWLGTTLVILIRIDLFSSIS